MSLCVCFVHATGTTDAHQLERRKFAYSEVCRQCRHKVGTADHVAAHVVAYPCFPCFCMNCCVGQMTLKTTCRRCNAKNSKGKVWVDRVGCFVDPFECSYSPLHVVIWPSCLHFDATARRGDMYTPPLPVRATGADSA